MARRSKYTEDTVRAITDGLQVGMTYEKAAARAGIAYETFRVWREEKPAFSVAIQKAEADAVARKLGRIEEAGRKGHWQADAWWLERKYPQEYGRTVVEANVKVEADSDSIAESLISRMFAGTAGQQPRSAGHGDKEKQP